MCCRFELSHVLHQFSFNMPSSGAEMTGLDRLLCASSIRKGGKKNNILFGLYETLEDINLHWYKRYN